ncbi:hypothetical protein [Janthinobacterium sp. JC611]|uniref:hypothetical protein n=1 Tax=Janthinobacterium sp. JC611 TaxID=2816201 RepID=UPI001BFE92BD|nr:hypothetical protein [Janthinobacterium sp. JC611]
MQATENQPILTDTYSNVAEFNPEAGSLFVYGDGTEERALHVTRLKNENPNVVFVQIVSETPSEFSVIAESAPYFLRSQASFSKFWERAAGARKVYVDMTGLTHPVWAALLREATKLPFEVLFVYVEPNNYMRSAAPVDGQIYELSSRINGIAPLPGFAVLSAKSHVNPLFACLLGFEGTRLKHIIENIDPNYEDIVPIVGVPGFKPSYLFETFLGNRTTLAENSIWQAVLYAPAHCPFSCFYRLKDLHEESPGRAMRIALVGTKPHALGAVLFHLGDFCATELVYDHPIRKRGRTDGTERLHVYHVSAIMKSKKDQRLLTASAEEVSMT